MSMKLEFVDTFTGCVHAIDISLLCDDKIDFCRHIFDYLRLQPAIPQPGSAKSQPAFSADMLFQGSP